MVCRSENDLTMQANLESSWSPVSKVLLRTSSDGVFSKSCTERIFLNGISASESPTSTIPSKPAGTAEMSFPARVTMQSLSRSGGRTSKTSSLSSCISASASLSGTEP